MRCLGREDREEIEAKLKRVILALWQTSEIRPFKLTVKDEIENGVAYHPTTFFTALPKLYASLEASIQREWGQELVLPNFFRIGSWIGGDRDGNPFVTADVTLYAAQRQAEGRPGDGAGMAERDAADITNDETVCTQRDETGIGRPSRAAVE